MKGFNHNRSEVEIAEGKSMGLGRGAWLLGDQLSPFLVLSFFLRSVSYGG